MPEALLCAGNCAELGPILRGEKDAVQVLFAGAGAELLDQFYGDGLSPATGWRPSPPRCRKPRAICRKAADCASSKSAPAPAALAAQVLPLLERGLHSYTFTDVSAGFFPGALQKLAAFPEVECKIFDLEKPGTEQGFEAGSFDFIIGTNVLHAVSDVRAALRHLHELLAPGGSLVFMDVATPQLWTEAVFGLTSGWWRFTDRDLRPHQPLLERAQWERVLREAGFGETASLPGLTVRSGRRPDRPARAQGSGSSRQVLCAGRARDARGKIVAHFRGRLRARANGSAARLRERAPLPRRRAAATNSPRWNRLASRCARKRPTIGSELLDACDRRSAGAHRLSLEPRRRRAGPGARTPRSWAPTPCCTSRRRSKHAARRRSCASISVTRGAQPVGREMTATAVAQAPAIGLFRVILNEHPNLACRGIDLPPAPSAADDTLLWSELLRTDTEREVAFRGEARYVQRLDRGRPAIEQTLDPAVPLRLESRERGHLDTLRFAPFALPPCGPAKCSSK